MSQPSSFKWRHFEAEIRLCCKNILKNRERHEMPPLVQLKRLLQTG